MCRHVVCIWGRRVSAQTTGRSECGSRSESAEFRVLDQPLNPGIVHFVLRLVYLVSWRRQQEPHPERTGRRARTHPHRYATTVNVLYNDTLLTGFRSSKQQQVKQSASRFEVWLQYIYRPDSSALFQALKKLIRETGCITHNKCEPAKGNCQAAFGFTSLSPCWCFISSVNVF